LGDQCRHQAVIQLRLLSDWTMTIGCPSQTDGF
jgi:hypothetical protein